MYKASLFVVLCAIFFIKFLIFEPQENVPHHIPLLIRTGGHLKFLGPIIWIVKMFNQTCDLMRLKGSLSWIKCFSSETDTCYLAAFCKLSISNIFIVKRAIIYSRSNSQWPWQLKIWTSVNCYLKIILIHITTKKYGLIALWFHWKCMLKQVSCSLDTGMANTDHAAIKVILIRNK